MATKESTLGIDHVTVVPENFEPTDALRAGAAVEELDSDEAEAY